ncbi:hypothetical protein GCM10028784_06470 [Myceligenerans cantabricum]
MDWSIVASSAVAAGLVSAVANGLFAWRRSVVETRDRRNESRRAYLREAVVDFLAAERLRWGRDFALAMVGRRFRAADEGSAERARASTEAPAIERELEHARHDVHAVIARIRLYSANLHKRALDVMEVARVPTSDAIDEEPEKLDDEDVTCHELALTRFLAEARAELGIKDL